MKNLCGAALNQTGKSRVVSFSRVVGGARSKPLPAPRRIGKSNMAIGGQASGDPLGPLLRLLGT